MEQNTAFIGSIPENYDKYLGPALFEPYASDLVERLNLSKDAMLLELACGTGIVTRHLRNKLPAGVKIAATDLSEAMINYARQKFAPDELVEWKPADMTDLSFEDESFEAIVCQFGFMFVPDKNKAFREAYRVLKPNGTLLFSVWDKIEQNDLANTTHTVIASFFEEDPPKFYEVPFSMYDIEPVKLLLEEAGFRNLQVTKLSFPCTSPSAAVAAKGLVRGNPVINAIMERRPEDLEQIESAVAKALADRFGDPPVQCKMQAIVFTVLK